MTPTLNSTHPQSHAKGSPAIRSSRRGLALVELLLAIAITSMITASVASVINAVARSEEFERDRRESTVRSQALDVRLSSYVTPSLAALDVQSSSFVLWLEDARVSDTVHASEIRWITYSNLDQSVILHYISFPAEWTQAQIDDADAELPLGTDWWDALNTYQTLNYISTVNLSDGVADFTISYDDATEKSEKIFTFNITFAGRVNDRLTVSSSSIREYQEPIS